MSGYWSSYDEVPKYIFDSQVGYSGGKMQARDPGYLRFLNDTYNPWVQEEKRKERKKKERRAKGLRLIPRASCFICESKISEEQLERVGRLCLHHEAELEAKKTMRVHGVELRCA